MLGPGSHVDLSVFAKQHEPGVLWSDGEKRGVQSVTPTPWALKKGYQKEKKIGKENPMNSWTVRLFILFPA